MDKDKFTEDVIAVAAVQLNIREEDIKLTSSFFNDLGIDSLDAVELIMAYSCRYDIEIDDKEAEELHTVNDIVENMWSKIEEERE